MNVYVLVTAEGLVPFYTLTAAKRHVSKLWPTALVYQLPGAGRWNVKTRSGAFIADIYRRKVRS